MENNNTNIKRVSFPANLKSALLSGLIVGMGIGLLLGLKISRINPSITVFKDTWILASHLMVLYGIAGMVIMGILGIILFPLLNKKYGIAEKTIFSFYIPSAFIIGLFFYIRSYIMSHFIANPLMPLKGSGFINLAFTLIMAGLAAIAIVIAYRIVKKLPFKLLSIGGGGFLLILWIATGIFSGNSSANNTGPNPDFEEFDIIESNQKVALIGIDGTWWKILDDLLEQDKLPNFKRLIDAGVRGELNTLYPTYSAMIWTSIATGKLPQKHNINSFLVWSFPVSGAKIPMFRLPMMAPELLWIQDNIATVSPIPSNYRTSEALWSIFTSMDKSVGIMSWWASWPAEKVNGYMYTDHALFSKMDVLTNYKDKQGGSIYDIYPPELIEELQQFNYTPEDFTDEDLDRFINVESEEFRNDFRNLDTYEYLDIAYEASMLKFTFPGDKTLISSAKYLLEAKGQPDFWAIYLQGMDSMSHQYMKYYFADENKEKLIPINIQRYGKLLEEYYIYMDETVGDFMAKLDPETNIIIVSDHGFDDGMLPTGHYHHIIPDSGDFSQDFHICESHPGIFIASGPNFTQGTVVENANILDITPTILAIMGFPYADDFDGRILSEILENTEEIDTIPTYDHGRNTDRTIIETSVDKEVRDKLKALGYVK